MLDRDLPLPEIIERRRAQLSELLRQERILSYTVTQTAFGGTMSITPVVGAAVEADIRDDPFAVVELESLYGTCEQAEPNHVINAPIFMPGWKFGRF